MVSAILWHEPATGVHRPTSWTPLPTSLPTLSLWYARRQKRHRCKEQIFGLCNEFFLSLFVWLLLESNSYSWFPIQGSNLCPCIGGWILNHWTTRKAPRMALWGSTCSPIYLCIDSLHGFLGRQAGEGSVWWTPPVLRLALAPPDPGSQVWGWAPLSVNWWPGSPKVLYADAALQAALSVSSIYNTRQVPALVDAGTQGRDGLSQELGSLSVCCSTMKCPSQGCSECFPYMHTNYCTTELFHLPSSGHAPLPPDKETKFEIITSVIMRLIRPVFLRERRTLVRLKQKRLQWII